MEWCDSCRRRVVTGYPHSCYRACRGCGEAIHPAEDYCGDCKAKEGT